MSSEPVPSAAGALRRFDSAMQRAVGVGLGLTLVVSVIVAILGRAIYPTWWWPVALVTFTMVAASVLGCAQGRFGTGQRIALAVVASVSALLSAVAVGDVVYSAGTAVLPIVLAASIGIGFLAAPAEAAALGGCLIAANTLVPALFRTDDAADLLVEGFIHVLVVAGAIGGGRLARRLAANEEQAMGRLAAAIATDRAMAAARAERRELEREMHDTVLNTLSAIGRSSLADSDTVRRRCAADARFLRTLRRDEAADRDLVAELRAMSGLIADDGFRVDLPTTIVPTDGTPPEVLTAIVRATREALNNAREHSGASGATVTLEAADGRIEVRVIDRGDGREAPPGPGRLGVRRSLTERMADVGGHAEVRSLPGVGTTIALRWPR